MRLTPSQAAKLARLSLGESLPKSDLSKSLFLPLRDAHAVRLEKSGSSYVVRGIPEKFARVVEQLWGIRDLEAFAAAIPENRNRGMLADVAGNSKALPTSPLMGILIRSFGRCYLHNKLVGETQSGTALLIMLSELPHLRVETDYLIGIEGVECLLKFEDTQKHFPQLAALNYTLVLRWHWGNAWREWLNGWKGQFLYFPDYDPAGLRVFVTEVLPHKTDARLLVPEDFNSILDGRGCRDLYLKQETLLPLKCQHEETAHLCNILKHCRKGLEQENLL